MKDHDWFLASSGLTKIPEEVRISSSPLNRNSMLLCKIRRMKKKLVWELMLLAFLTFAIFHVYRVNVFQSFFKSGYSYWNLTCWVNSTLDYERVFAMISRGNSGTWTYDHWALSVGSGTCTYPYPVDCLSVRSCNHYRNCSSCGCI